jgi:hypothetical protein
MLVLEVVVNPASLKYVALILPGGRLSALSWQRASPLSYHEALSQSGN